MGFLDFSSSASTESKTENKSVSDDSIIDLANADGSHATSVKNINAETVGITLSDYGAVNRAFSSVDKSIDAIREQSGQAVASSEKGLKEVTKAITEFGRPDAGATEKTLIIVGLGVVAAIFIIKVA